MPRVTRLLIRQLACIRNERTLFSALDVTVEAGGVLLLTGANGVGKSSLLRILGGLLPPAAGQASLEPASADLPLAERTVLISTRDPLKSALTVREQIRDFAAVTFAGEQHGRQPGEAAAAALSAFALEPLADVPCGYLSSGQRRRVSLSRLALSSPAARPLWLLDEPANALDAGARALLAVAVSAHRAAGGMVVAATHDPLGWPDADALDLSALKAGTRGTAA
jgi:heme exporter protein A